MKKIVLLLACVVLGTTAIIVSCSDDKEVNTGRDAKAKSLPVAAAKMKGEVPKDRLIYNVLGTAESLSLNELVETYNKDVSSAGSDYVTNLKNMWLTVLNPRVYNEGTEDQKLFFINEQVALENNLAHFTGFYNLLAVSKKMDRAQKDRIADTYYQNNLKAIAEVHWPNPGDDKKKESELIYAKRNFTNLVNTQK